ncbi:cyanidin 3-O-galactoside 2''-O-xylosyltransferase FGGT1 [Cannabis sativa]|uniref:cyanidin 3-O-galactoside 2''-O-xylosyltransferase FGGT1 n=1 Tax=Cannabis sativa TaxID=3483 RepID=UPI0029CA780D|nr:cyanidin 3-O-galactoside 2''-O-xylosyltransferase FGGT1 [Cannabis sativa]
MHYSVVNPAATAHSVSPAALHNLRESKITETDLMKPLPGYPDSSIHLHFHEARALRMYLNVKPSSNSEAIHLFDRLYMSLAECDVIGIKGCRETDGMFVNFLKKDFKKPILLTGPLIPDPPSEPLEKKWQDFLGEFNPNSVIYCCLGSEVILTKSQFQELLLGLELSGLPFLAVLRTPSGVDSIEEALPDGFQERIGGRGVVYGGWIQQPQILNHPSIGCNVTHCGWGSLFEALGAKSKCELVLIPMIGDQIYNARTFGNTLKAGIEVEKSEEKGLFTKESVFEAIKTVMDEDNEVGKEVRANLAKLRQNILRNNFESSYIEDFINKLKTLLG